MEIQRNTPPARQPITTQAKQGWKRGGLRFLLLHYNQRLSRTTVPLSACFVVYIWCILLICVFINDIYLYIYSWIILFSISLFAWLFDIKCVSCLVCVGLVCVLYNWVITESVAIKSSSVTSELNHDSGRVCYVTLLICCVLSSLKQTVLHLKTHKQTQLNQHSTHDYQNTAITSGSDNTGSLQQQYLHCVCHEAKWHIQQQGINTYQQRHTHTQEHTHTHTHTHT